MSALIVALNPDSDNNGDLGAVPVYNVNTKVVVETGTSVTVGPQHYGTDVYLDNAAAIAVTLPKEAPKGTQINFIQWAAGAATFSAASGATRVSNGSKYKTNGQYSGLVAKVQDNSNGTSAAWVLVGNLTT